MSLPAGIELRDYQPVAVEALRGRFASGFRQLVLVAPTGAGKTVMASTVMQSAESKGRYVLFLAHRRELVHQCSAKLTQFGVRHGIIMAGEVEQAAFCQVASIQTLASRTERGRPLPPCDLLVIDECHRSLAATYVKLIEHYRARGATVLGLTATPVRGDGRGLGDVYQALVNCPSIASLTEQGYLVPVRYFAPTIPDLTSLKVRGGEYVMSEAQALMNRDTLVGDVVENWHRIARELKTVVFASGVDHSIHLAREFEASGVAAAHLDGSTPKDERDEILEDLRRGGLQVITQCDVLTEGWDMPDVSCAVIARPTKSVVRYLQMAGRILRPAPDKQHATLIDHAGCVYEHGFLREFGEWDLEASKGETPNAVQRERKAKGATPLVCEKCTTVFTGQPECPECGHKYERKGRGISVLDARLGEIKGVSPEAQATGYTQAEKRAFWAQLQGFQRTRGYRSGWAWHAYQAKFKEQPKRAWRNDVADFGPEVDRWARYLRIRYAKGKASSRQAAHA